MKKEGEVKFDAGEFFKTISILVVTYKIYKYNDVFVCLCVAVFKLRIPSQIRCRNPSLTAKASMFVLASQARTIAPHHCTP